MSDPINPPVERLLLLGPKKQGELLAQNLYPICCARHWVPAFYRAGFYTKTLQRQIFHPITRTGAILFGPDRDGIYEQLCEEAPWMKNIRLLEPDEPWPKPAFSYHEQIFPAPKEQGDYERMVSWMGITPYGGRTEFQGFFPGAMPVEKLTGGTDDEGGYIQSMRREMKKGGVNL